MKPNPWMQRGLGMLMVLVVFVAANPPAAEATVTTLGQFALSKGDEIFWDGPTGLTWATIPSFNPEIDCEAPWPGQLAPCIEYEIEVLEPAFRLRVAMDTPEAFFVRSPDDDFYLALYDPAGHFVIAGIHVTYSAEAAVENPVPGIWRARVVPTVVSDATFRMRAKLEAHPPNDNRNNLLYPNLRIIPPFEFFLLPTGGCLPGETGLRCLRFSVGPENIGGRLELILGREGHATPTGGTTIQRIYRADGTFEEREAGTYEFHEEHGHFHHDAIADTRLFRVTDPARGTLEPAGAGRKIGFCLADGLMAQWHSFANDPGPVWDGSGCGSDPMQESRMGLTPGWADAYVYSQEGNYVDFGDNPDGLYVLRVKANDEDSIHETTTADNNSYALIEVEGDSIAVLERGYGTSPWDPQKQLAADFRYLLAEGGFPFRESSPPLTMASFSAGAVHSTGAPPSRAREQVLRAQPPVTGGSTFLAFASVPTRPATITIYDTSGRLVRSIGVGAGADGATWDGRAADGNRVASGLYFARFSDSATPAIARIVVTR